MDNIFDDNLSIENKDANPIVDTELKTFLDKYEGDELNSKTLDSNNNLVDATGKVLKTYDELKEFAKSKLSTKVEDKIETKVEDSSKDNTLKEGDVVEIENEQYTIDKDGNAVKDGKIIFTKDQLDTSDAKDDTKILSKEVYDLTGFTLQDENGNVVEYDFNKPTGIAEYSKDLLELHGDTIANARFNSLMDANPEIYDMLLYKQRHGNLDGFKDVTDWSKVTLDKDNVDQLKDINIKYLLSKGNDVDTAKKIVKYYETDGILLGEAEKAKGYLIQKDKDDKALAKKMLNEKVEAENNRWNNKVKSVIDLVNKGTIDNIVIPEIIKVRDNDGKTISYSRQDFINYYVRKEYKDETGNLYSQYEADRLTLREDGNITNELKDAFLMFVKGDLSSVVKANINKEQVKIIKKIKTNTVVTNKQTQSNNKVKVTLDGLD